MKASFNSKSVTSFADQCTVQHSANFEAYKANQLQGKAVTVKAVKVSTSKKVITVCLYVLPVLVILSIVI